MERTKPERLSYGSPISKQVQNQVQTRRHTTIQPATTPPATSIRSAAAAASAGLLLFQICQCYIAAFGIAEASCCRYQGQLDRSEENNAQLMTVIEPN